MRACVCVRVRAHTHALLTLSAECKWKHTVHYHDDIIFCFSHSASRDWDPATWTQTVQLLHFSCRVPDHCVGTPHSIRSIVCGHVHVPPPSIFRASLVALTGKNLPAVQETWVWSLGWKIPWRREWQPAPVLLPGEFHGQRSLVGYNPCGHRESDMTEQLTLTLVFVIFTF